MVMIPAQNKVKNFSRVKYTTNAKQINEYCAKSVQKLSFFWSVFSCVRTEREGLRRKSLYSVRIQENTDQKKLRICTLFTQ